MTKRNVKIGTTHHKYKTLAESFGMPLERFYNVGSVLSVEQFNAELDALHAHQSDASTQLKHEACHVVEVMFGSVHNKKSGKLKVANGHNHLFWYQMTLVIGVERFKEYWSDRMDFETGKYKPF